MDSKAGLGGLGGLLVNAGKGWVRVVGLSLRVNKKRIVTQEAKGLEKIPKISKNFKHCKFF